MKRLPRQDPVLLLGGIFLSFAGLLGLNLWKARGAVFGGRVKGVTLGMADTGVMPFLLIASLTSSIRYSSSSFMQKQLSLQELLSTRSFKSTRAALVGSKYS